MGMDGADFVSSMAEVMERLDNSGDTVEPRNFIIVRCSTVVQAN